MAVTLTSAQIEVIVNALYDSEEFCECFELDDTTSMYAEGHIERESYIEDDYFNGTGAVIETSREVYVHFTIYSESNESLSYESEDEIIKRLSKLDN